MKTITKRNPVCFGLAGIMALGLWASVSAQAADPNEEMYRSEEAKEEGQMMEPGAAEMPAEMGQQKQGMRAKLRAQDAELAEHVAQMNAAPDVEKVGMMAALLTKMVEQRAEMHAHMEVMQENMRQWYADGPGRESEPEMPNDKQ